MVALLELTYQAIDEAERTTRKMAWDLRISADRARPSAPEAFRDKLLCVLGAAE